MLQKALTSLLLFKPASASLERDFQGPAAWGEARKPAKKSAATMSMLLARFNQLYKFAVNFISDCGVEEVEESSLEAMQGLATALLTMWLDIEARLHRTGASTPWWQEFRRAPVKFDTLYIFASFVRRI